jgi:hypothetical protein
MSKITPSHITFLLPNEIFVFGSNMSGRHGKGAAKTAMKWGAIYGKPSGIQGNTYAIPTVNASISDKLPVEKIKPYVDEFIAFAKANPQFIFLVTEIGCGLAGHDPDDIAPLFKEAKGNNICLPMKFIRILKKDGAKFIEN